MRLFKWIFSLLLVVLLVPVAAALWLLFAFDPNDYRSQIQNLAAEKDIDLNIGGDMSWQFLPEFGISAQQIELDARQRDASGTIGEITLALDWQRLLKQEIAVRELSIDRADLKLGDPGLLFAAAAPAAGEIEVESGESNFSLAVDSLTISDSQLQLSDEEGAVRKLEALNLKLSRLSLDGERFPLQLSLRTPLNQSPLNQEQPDSQALDIELTSELAFDQSQQHLRAEAAQIKATIHTAEAAQQLTANFDLLGDLNQQQLDLKPLTLNLNGLPLEGELHYNIESGQLVGQLASATFDLKQQLKSWGIEAPRTSAPKALTDLKVSSEFSLSTTQSSSLSGTIALDGQPLQLALKHNPNNKLLGIKLSGSALEIANYLPPESEASDQSTALLAPLLAPASLWQGPSDLQLEFGQLQLNPVQLNPLQLKQVKAHIKTRPGQVQIENISAQVFGGTLKATGKLSDKGGTPAIQLNPVLTNIDLAQALPALADFRDLTGLLSMQASISGRGDNPDQLIQTLDGGGQFALANPVYSALNIEKSFCDAAAMVSQRPAQNRQWPNGTALENLTGRFHFENGQLIIDNYRSGTGNIQLAGRGRVRLSEQRYNFNADTRVNGDTTSEQGCRVGRKLRNRTLPFECKGSYAEGGSASCKPDDRLVKELIQGALLDKLGDKLFKKPDSEENTEGEEKPVNPLEELLKGVLGPKR